ncbi:MAG TPA: hypothetical protein VN736_22840 [Candidatus Limnocylindrales bacterium]|nr:hypothetical protein [Candidatus Limnocylindrales bacterium]
MKSKYTGPPEKFALYEKLIAGISAVELKGAANPYTSINGHMTSRLDPSGKLALRLPPDEREKFLSKYDAKLFESYGIVQKEYIEVPDALLRKTAELKRYFEISVKYVQTLKPK